MGKYKIYIENNYFYIVDNISNKSYEAHKKDVLVLKDTIDKTIFRFRNVNGFEDTTSIKIGDILKKNGSAYTYSEFEEFYTQNTGNFNTASGGSGAVDSVNGETGVVVLTTGDISEDTDANYVTDAQLAVINNTSGTNTGDQDLTPYQLKPSEGPFVDGDKTKLDGLNNLFLGTYLTLAALTAAHPTPEDGSEAHINEVGATQVQKAIWDNEDEEWVIVGSVSIGGSSSLEFQTPITASDTILDGSQKGLNKVYPFNKATAQTVTIETGDYVENDVINILRLGAGPLEIVAGAGVKIRGVRNSENRRFVNDPNSMVSILCKGSEEFSIIGNLTRGYSGAVTTSSYGPLREGDTAVDVPVIGTGFSENMSVSVSGDATQSSDFTFISNTEITLHLTATGTVDDTVTVTYDNGDIYEDIDAITIISAPLFLYDTNPFEVGYALFKLNNSFDYALRIRRTLDDAETDVGFNASFKVDLDSPVSVGGTLAGFAGVSDVHIRKIYNQGSAGSTFDFQQSTNSLQPKLMTAGAMIVGTDVNFMETNGTSQYMATSGSDTWNNGSLTVFGYFRANALHNGNAFASTLDNPNRNFFFGIQATGSFRMGAYDSVNSATAATGAASANTNYKVAGWKNNTETRASINGVSGAAQIGLTAYSQSLPLYFGVTNSLSGYYNGKTNYLILYKSDQSANVAAIETILSNFL